jgi:hypothetical protein
VVLQARVVLKEVKAPQVQVALLAHRAIKALKV